MGNCLISPKPKPGPTPAPVVGGKRVSGGGKRPKDDRTVLKFLLLGAGESGKSTLFKQMRINYVNDYSQEGLIQEREKIIKAFIASFGDLVRSIREYSGKNTIGSGELDALSIDFYGDPNSRTPKQPQNMSPELHKFMKQVWESDMAQAVWEDRSSYQVTDSLSYFCENMDRVCDKKYVPTEEDYLRCRVITVGILEQTFQHRGVTMIVVDVGGQRSERRKWVQAFAGVDAVFFVAAISEFNQQLFEDGSIARYDEAVSLFKKTVNILFFRETPFVLFLNKEDLFDEKLQNLIEQNKNLDDYFPTLKLGHNYENAGEIIKEHVKSLFIDQETSGRVYPHFVTATDRGAFELVFKSATSIVLREALNEHFDSKRAH